MKKEAIVFLSLIFLLPFISAQFSFSDISSIIDSQSIFLLVAFGAFGIILSTILNRFPAFKGPTAGIMSLLLSLGMTWGINKWINVNDFFSNIGFSGDFSPYLLFALLIVIIISMFVFKWKAPLILGLLFVIMALFTDLVSEKTIVLVTGIVLIVIGLIWRFGGRRLNPRLVLEAKAFRIIADKQPNPKMYRNLAHFTSYLKGRQYGRDEKEICMRMGIRQKDITKAVKRYII